MIAVKPWGSLGVNLAYISMAALIVSVSLSVGIPIAESVVNYKSIAAGKLVRVSDAQGYTGWSKTLYFAGYSRSGTGGINDFNTVKLGSTGYVMPRLGFTSDTPTCLMTVTGIAINSVTYTASAAGAQRLWVPDRGEPDEVTGEDSWSWDAINSVVDINTSGPSTIVVTWFGSSGDVRPMISGAQTIINLFPIIIVMMLVGAVKSPDNAGLLIRLAVVAGIIVFMASFITALGF